MLMGASFQLVYLTISTCGLPVLAFSRPIIQECNQQGERVAQRYRLLCHRWVSPQSPASLAARGGERVTQGAPPMFAHLTVAVV